MLWVGSRDRFLQAHDVLLSISGSRARARTWKVRSWNVEFVLEEFFGPHRYIERCIEPVLFLISLHSIVSVLIYIPSSFFYLHYVGVFPSRAASERAHIAKKKEKQGGAVPNQLLDIVR